MEIWPCVHVLVTDLLAISVCSIWPAALTAYCVGVHEEKSSCLVSSSRSDVIVKDDKRLLLLQQNQVGCMKQDDQMETKYNLLQNS